MIYRYALHAGKGRSWQVDPALTAFLIDTFEDWRMAKWNAQRLQEEYDWWIIFDLDDGMSHFCGWSTGRTTSHLQQIDLRERVRG